MVKNYGDQRRMFSAKADNTVPSKICTILQIVRKPNAITVLLFIQNNFQFENELKLAYLDRYLVGLRSMAVLVESAK